MSGSSSLSSDVNFTRVTLSTLVGILLWHGACAMPMPPVALRSKTELHASGCCVSYGVSYDGSECCHEFRDETASEACVVPPGWVGGGLRFYSDTCERTKQLKLYSPGVTNTLFPAAIESEATETRSAPEITPCKPPSLCISTGFEHPVLPANSQQDSSASKSDRLIGHGGPTWTHSSTSASPQGERKVDSWKFTPTQQQSLHVDANGVKIDSEKQSVDSRWITPVLSNGDSRVTGDDNYS